MSHSLRGLAAQIGRDAVRRLVKPTKDNLIGGPIFGLVGVVLEAHIHGWSVHAILDNLKEVVLLPWLLVACLLFVWHLMQVAREAAKEERIPFTNALGGTSTRLPWSFRWRRYCVMLLYLLLPITCSYWAVEKIHIDAARSPAPANTNVNTSTENQGGPEFHENISRYYFSLGENGLSVGTSVEELKHGSRPFVGFPITVFSVPSDNKVHYRVTIWSGLQPIEITDGRFSLNEPYWDRNFDPKALEIVDENRKPVLQLIWTTPNHLVVNGIFRLGNGTIIADSHGMRPMKPGDEIKRLFKYPSWRFPGQLAP